jgi:hypothetical protein
MSSDSEKYIKLKSLCVKLIDVYYDIARDKDGQQLYSIVKQIKNEIEPKP